MRQLVLPGCWPKKVQEAIDFLKRHEPIRGYFLAFSGGKDSIAIMKLCDLAGVKYDAYYSITTIDPPEILKFIRFNYPKVEWLRPKENFYKLVERKSPPLIKSRWCCDYLKEKAGIEIKKSYPLHITGIRAEESGARARRPRFDIHHKIPTTMNIKPIFNWTEGDVWSFIEDMGLSYPSLYDEGFGRIGCVICPFIMHKNQTKLNKHRDRWPAMYRAFENACRKWYENKESTDCRHGSFERYMKSYYTGFEELEDL